MQDADLKVSATSDADGDSGATNEMARVIGMPDPGTKKILSEAQLAANRANLQRAMAAREGQAYVLTTPRLQASRRNLVRARAVYRNTIYSMAPEQQAECFRKNLQAAQEELERNGQHLWHGMTCASLLGSLRPAGEKLEDLQQHFARFQNALRPRDAGEAKVVYGLAELMWRRLRGLRLGGRWEARKLAAVLAKRKGGAPPPPQPDDAAETAADRAAARGEYAGELAFDILQVFERVSGLIQNLETIQRNMMILVRSFGRRSGEPLLAVFHCGEGREQQAAARGEDTIGNPFAPPAGGGRKSTGGNSQDARLKPASTQYHQRHQEVSNVKGLGKAASVATPEQFTAAFMAAMGSMSAEALGALKDLAEAVCARLRLLEAEAVREAQELVELLAAEPLGKKAEEKKNDDRQAGATEEGEERQDAGLKVGATEGDAKEATEGATSADGDSGATAGGDKNRWRGFREAQEILQARIRGSKNSKAFGVCLSLGLVDILLEGDNRLLRGLGEIENSILGFMDRWMSIGCGQNWVW